MTNADALKVLGANTHLAITVRYNILGGLICSLEACLYFSLSFFLRLDMNGSGKHSVTVWRPSVCLSVRPPSRHTHRYSMGQHATRPAYISARQ